MPRADSHRRQIVADIIRKVNSGEFPPGTTLPVDRILADQYGCSTTPVKQAMDELSIRGYVIRHQGKATRISDAPPIERS